MPFNPASAGRYSADVDFAGDRAIPEGWTWYSMPVYYGPGDVDSGQLNMVVNSRTPYETAVERLRAFRDWAIAQDLWVEFSGSKALSGGVVRVYARLNPGLHFDPEMYDSLAQRPSPYDEEVMVDPFDAEDSEGRPLRCVRCNAALHFIPLKDGRDAGFTPEGVEEGAAWVGCANCFMQCMCRDEVMETPEQAARQAALLGRPSRAARPRKVRGPYCGKMCMEGKRSCAEHYDPYTCSGCAQEFDKSYHFHREEPGTDRVWCETCYSRRCSRCFGERGTSRRALDDAYVCQACWEIAERIRIEIIDREVRMTPEQLLIPALPDRPVRLMSIEQEFEGINGNEGNHIARELYTAGLSCYGERMRYHAGDHTYPAHVERDRTVESGGELIYNRLDLSSPSDAAHMHGICNIIQTAQEAGRITFTARCGTHNHIDLHGYTIPDARNYVTIYSYLEDVIFRLGSAGYGDHRSIVSKSDYSMPIKKDKWGNIVEFGVEFLRNADHTDSLNMQHFYNSLKHCECGAIEFGNIMDCTCVRPKCTAEWRVFNGTGNPRKLHAWAALVQAVTSWCQSRELDLDLYEPLGFEQEIDFTKDLTDAHRNLIEAWKPRLMWMWTYLPLVEGEKESLMYCIRNSALVHVGEDFLAELAQVERVQEPERELALTVIASRFGPGEEDEAGIPPEDVYEDEWVEDEEPYNPEF